MLYGKTEEAKIEPKVGKLVCFAGKRKGPLTILLRALTLCCAGEK